MLLLTSIFLLFIIFDESATASQPSHPSYRIQYGKNVLDNEHVPYVVGLLRYIREIGEELELRWACGGTLLTGTVVLTAAHCVYFGTNSVLYVSHREGDQPFNWKLNVKYNVSYVVVHKMYTHNENYDIGVIKLKFPVNDLGNKDVPILNTTPIPDYGYKYILKLYGGGLIENNGTNDHLQEMELVFHPTLEENCRFQNIIFCYKGLRYNSSNNRTLTHYGDSGAPILLTKEDEDGESRTYLIGVHFSRISKANGESIGMAMNVIHFFTWINTIIHEYRPTEETFFNGVYLCCEGLED